MSTPESLLEVVGQVAGQEAAESIDLEIVAYVSSIVEVSE